MKATVEIEVTKECKFDIIIISINLMPCKNALVSLSNNTSLQIQVFEPQDQFSKVKFSFFFNVVQ